MYNSILVLGIGNILMGDEGVGVHVANQLERENLPLRVSVLDGGTGGFHLLGHMENHDLIIMVDATLDGNPPGTIKMIKPRFAADFPKAMSTHDIGLKDLVVTLQLLDKMPEIILYAISIDTIQQQGIYLNDPIKEAKDKVIESILALIQDKVN